MLFCFFHGIGNSNRKSGTPQQGNIHYIIADVAGFFIGQSFFRENSFKWFRLHPRHLVKVRHAKLSCASLHDRRLASRDDRDFQACPLRHYHRMAVFHVERFGFVAVGQHYDSAIGEYPVAIEDQKSDLSRAFGYVVGVGQLRFPCENKLVS